MNESEEEPASMTPILPEACISDILSVIISPRDACRIAAVSKAFNIAADSDAVWDRFLPSDYRKIMAKAVSPLVFDSKKQLYRLLLESYILLDSGRLAFNLDKESGKKCFMLGARDMGFMWREDKRYWTSMSVPDSRFTEVTLLIHVCWLQIWGTISTVMLSRKTTYVAYLVFDILNDSYGLDVPARVSISFNGEMKSEKADVYIQQRERTWNQKPAPPPRTSLRKDGWMEVEFGEFNSDDADAVVCEILFLEYGSWKRGLVVDGIEVRPKLS